MTLRIYCATLLATCVLGQTVESPPAFEAASVKLTTGGAPYVTDDPGQIEIRNLSLMVLICRAYGVNGFTLSGPDWLGSVMVEVVAKLPASVADLPRSERNSMTNLMLQALLAERFKLKVHREEKVIPGYALVVAPGGPKMRRVEWPGGGFVDFRAGSITVKGTPMATIVSAASNVGRLVRDMTGLSGYYEFNLRWTPDDLAAAGADKTPTAGDDRPPSIFTALQEQLGLKLEPQKFTMQIVVVDHIERVPTEN